MSRKSALGLRFDDEHLERWRSDARARGLTLTAYIEEALDAYAGQSPTVTVEVCVGRARYRAVAEPCTRDTEVVSLRA